MMKYAIKDVVIPHEKRKEINEKILHIIDSSLVCDITREDIFNAYTGDGGLHGLERKGFSNFHEYSQAKKEIEQGQFFTPHHLCKFIVDCIRPTKYDLIADLTCGMGNFFNALPVESNVYGNELDIKAYKVAKHLYPEANIAADDIRVYDPKVHFDIIFGNPPFNLKWNVGKEEYLSQLYYCLKSYELLKPAGLLVLIVPDSFLSDLFMDGKMIEAIDKRFNFICQFGLPADSFKSLGVSSFTTKIIVFQKQNENLPATPYTVEKVVCPSFDPERAAYLYGQYIRPVFEQKEKIKSKLFFENNHNDQEEIDFQYSVKKLLFAIKQHPAINTGYGKCLDYVNQYYNQKKPKDMKWEEWEEVRLTKDKVLSFLKSYLNKQHLKEFDKIELVKTDYGLKLKAYSEKMKSQLGLMNGSKAMSFNDMILNKSYPFEDQRYKPLFLRKTNSFLRQDRLMKDVEGHPEIRAFLDNFFVYDRAKRKLIQLNNLQKGDLEKILDKRYSILNWQQGSGKTLAGIAWSNYLLSMTNIRNIFVVSSALSINLTWDEYLNNFGQRYINIQSQADIYKIQPGQFVIISLDMLIKYQRFIKKFVRMQSYKVGLIVDESDELTNDLSQRTKATLSCFRKVQYKLLTTGTTTRNNINELYSQLELLYNNSINMLCECEQTYFLDKEGEIGEETNPFFLQPFPAYHGKTLFKSCFNPHKVTVFGIKKHNQNIYNKDHLEHLIEKTIITRKFSEIVGRKIYDIKTHRIKQNAVEREVYRVIMQEFYKMIYLFHSTGNSRRDSMLKLIRQIKLLIKSTSIPHKFNEYTGNELPAKYNYIFSLVEKFKNEKVAIGTVFIESVQDYYDKLTQLYPDRPIFCIMGNVSFKKRKAILAEFQLTENGILISTQQSLKASVNVPMCNKVIIESLQWNLPKIEQFYFRFIRYDSKDFKEVHFVIYDQTIDTNLMALVLAKERVNEYIKTLNFKDEADIFSEFDIDLDIFEAMIEKTEDEEGHICLKWGEQKIS